MGCYGYHRDTTPNIDAIAAEGVRFNDCYTASSPCVPSRASFMSGRFAIHHGALSHWGPGYDFQYPDGDGHTDVVPFTTRYFRNAGYKTVTFSTFGDRHKAWWYFAGWNEVHTHSLKEGNEDANEVTDAVIPWLKQHGKEDNYFLHIQFWDPHSLYTSPDEYAEMWQDVPAKAFPDEADIERHQQDNFPRSARFLHTAKDIPAKMPRTIATRGDFVKLVNGFDAGINYMDAHVGKLVETLRELGIEEEVCWIISADHAESMGEQGIYMEHASATEAVHHIPLIIKVPGMTHSKAAVDGFVYNVDVMATIAELLGLPVPQGWDGESFLQALQGQPWQGRDHLVMDHGLYTCQRTVRDRKWSFIRTYHSGLYRFDDVTLYDMERDPYQRENVAEAYPDVVKEMDHRLADWVQINLRKGGFKPDPMQAVIESGPYRYVTLEQWAGRLRAEGCEEEANALLRKYSACS
jgi:arylsulfatase A-like enzyme